MVTSLHGHNQHQVFKTVVAGGEHGTANSMIFSPNSIYSPTFSMQSLSVQQENNRRMETALASFAGLVVIAILFFVLDKLSDYGCDWWSDTCVQVSRIFVLFYTGVLGVIGWQVD